MLSLLILYVFYLINMYSSYLSFCAPIKANTASGLQFYIASAYQNSNYSKEDSLSYLIKYFAMLYTRKTAAELR